MSGQRKRHRIFLRLLLSYMIILVIPISVWILTYVRTVSVVRDEVIHANLAILNQGKAVLDRRFDEIRQIVTQLLQDHKVDSFQYLREPFTGSNAYKVLDLEHNLHDYSISNNFISDYFIFFQNSDLVMSSNRTYKSSYFYSSYFQYGQMDYESWRQMMLAPYHQNEYFPAATVTIQGRQREMVVYAQSLGRPDRHHGAVMVLIDDEEIRKLLSGLDLSDGGWAYIADEEGRLISHVGTVPGSFDPQWIAAAGTEGVIAADRTAGNVMLTYTTSAYNGWTYVAGQPVGIALHKVQYLKQVTYYVFALAMLAGIAMAYALAYRDSKPIRKVVNALLDNDAGSPGAAQSAFGFIEHSVSRLIENNHALKVEVQRQAPLLRAVYLDRWIKGELEHDPDAVLHMRHIGIELEGNAYLAAVLRISGFGSMLSEDALTRLDWTRVVVKQALTAAIAERGYLQDIDSDKIAIVLSCPQSGGCDCKERLGRMIESIHEEMKERSGIGFILATGTIGEHWSDVSVSYQEALQALHYNIRENREGIKRFEDLPAAYKGYYFPAEAETKLMNLAKSGNEEEALKLLDEIYRTNMERALPLPLLRLLVHDLWGSLVKLAEEIRWPEEDMLADVMDFLHAANFDSFEDQAKSFDAIADTYRQICRIVNQRKKSRNTELADGILRYIHERYAAEDLSLTGLSDKFQLSEAYISQFFKEQTGTNFFEYLESLRMENAMKFLKETGAPIQEIAAKVGYHSASTFRRAFKRVHGISPTDYRNSLES